VSSLAGERHPISLNRRLLAHGVMHFKYASLLMQEMTLELDEDFIFALIDFGKFGGALLRDEPKSWAKTFRIVNAPESSFHFVQTIDKRAKRDCRTTV
jgi:hypothetical protein